MKYWIQILFLSLLLTSCDYFKAPRKPKAIARVGESYLFESDIVSLVPKGTSKKDSISIVKSFIERWATQKILFEAAEKNIGKDKVDEYNVLIEQYKVDLYTKAYLENLVIRQIDTVVIAMIAADITIHRIVFFFMVIYGWLIDRFFCAKRYTLGSRF